MAVDIRNNLGADCLKDRLLPYSLAHPVESRRGEPSWALQSEAQLPGMREKPFLIDCSALPLELPAPRDLFGPVSDGSLPPCETISIATVVWLDGGLILSHSLPVRLFGVVAWFFLIFLLLLFYDTLIYNTVLGSRFHVTLFCALHRSSSVSEGVSGVPLPRWHPSGAAGVQSPLAQPPPPPNTARTVLWLCPKRVLRPWGRGLGR